MISEITIGNMRQAKPGQPWPAQWVYVGRPTRLGNPYPLPHAATEAQRQQVIRNYANWLDGVLHQPSSDPARMMAELEQIAREGEGIMTLVCWCHPLPCHADVIRARLEQRLGLGEWADPGPSDG